MLLLLPTGIDLVASFLGAMMIGAVPSIMPPPTPKQLPQIYWSSHRELFALIGPSALVMDPATAAAYRDGLPEWADRICECGEIDAAGPLPAPSVTADCIAFLQHSSGTTALKKGVEITHRAALEHLDRYAEVLEFTEADVVASWLPLYHDMGLVACMLLPLMWGAATVLIDPFEWLVRPQLLLRAITRFGATFCWMPNFAFERMASIEPEPGVRLSSLRAVINCSEPCKRSSQEKFASRFAASGLGTGAVQASYAMAENVFAVTQTSIGSPTISIRLAPESLAEGRVIPAASGGSCVEVVSCGPVMPETRVRIVDSRRRPLPPDGIGEIAVCAPSLFTGYYHRPHLTEAALRDGWYYTKDVGFMHDGQLYVLGRADDVLIVRGRKFVAHQLESGLSELPGVKPGRVVAFSTDSEKAGTQELVVLFEAVGTEPEATVSRRIRDHLDATAGILPQYVRSVPAGMLRKSTSGKISRAANKKWFELGLNGV